MMTDQELQERAEKLARELREWTMKGYIERNPVDKLLAFAHEVARETARDAFVEGNQACQWHASCASTAASRQWAKAEALRRWPR